MRRLHAIVITSFMGCAPPTDAPVGPHPRPPLETVDSASPETGLEDTAPPTPVCDSLRFEQTQSFTLEDLLPPRSRWAPTTNRGPGVALGDLDGDGWLDAVVNIFDGPLTFLRNDRSGQLVLDEKARLIGGEPLPGAIAVALEDVDGDGDLDIFLGARRGRADRILFNRGGLRFEVYALPDSEGESKTGAFGDVDGDGDLDLFVAGFTENPRMNAIEAGDQVGDGNYLYIQEADGSFTRSSDRLPAEIFDGLTYEGAWLDAEGDGDLDLYITNDYGPLHRPNALLLNDGRGYFSVDNGCACDVAIAGMGVAVGDANGDGAPDLYLTDWGVNHLLVNAGDGSFYDATLSMNALPEREKMGPAWGTTFLDADQDGRQDVAFMVGASSVAPSGAGDNPQNMLDGLLRGVDGGFTDVTALTRFGDGDIGRALAVGDLNRDGRPDLVTAGVVFARTWINRGGCGPGVTLRLDDPNSQNRRGVGAAVEVTYPGGTYTRWLLPGSTYSSSAHELYLGLAGYNRADRVAVRWPDGRVSALFDVPAGAEIVASPDL